MAGRTRFGQLAAAIAAVLAATIALVALTAAPVAAHAGLETSIPAPSSVLATSPPSIVLVFDEPVEAGATSILLYDVATGEVAIGPATSGADTSVVTANVPQLADGLYAVVWRTISLDGHVVDGAFSFQVGTAAVGEGGRDLDALLDEVRAGVAAPPAVGRAADVSRLLAFVGVVLLLGAGAFALAAPPALAQLRATAVLVLGGWVLLAVSSLASFLLLGATAVAGGLGDALTPDAWERAAELRTGRILLLRLALVLGAGALLAIRGRRASAWWRTAAVVLGVAIVASFPAAGHPSARDGAALWVFLDGMHLAAVAVWLGGLALFTLGGRDWLGAAEAEPLVRRFSRAATWLVPVIVATGALQVLGLAGTGGLDSLTDTAWGRNLLVKLSIVAVLLALAGVSRWLLQVSGAASLRRTVAAEAVLGLAVLAVTANLVTLPPRPVPEARVFNTTVTQAGVLADITVTPGRVGANEVHVLLTPPGGSLRPIEDVTARVSLPARQVPNTPVELRPDGPNHATGELTLPFSGDWTLELVVEVTPGSTVLISTTVPVP